jgi:Ca2+-binding RTX toxin-like protein
MADIAGDSTTTTLIAVGGTLNDSLEVEGDHDWVRLELVAGQTVTITLEGAGAAPLEDPLLRVRDSAGVEIASNDDFGDGYDSQIQFTATTSGIYYVDVGAFDDSYTGTYQLTVTESVDEAGAYFQSEYGFDITATDLHFYYLNATDFSLELGANVDIFGVVYPDQYYVIADNGEFQGLLDLYGSAFQGDSSGRITAGTVNFMGEIDLGADAVLWFAEGISLSAVAIYDAALTPSNADDLQLIAEAFSGDDTMVLSDFNDVMAGFGGDDLIYGYGGRDVLAGNSGADILHGGDGDDTISADRSIGFDTGKEVDELHGGAGDDMIFAGFGDIVDGGDGRDVVALSYFGATEGITGDTAILHRGQPLVPGGGTMQNVERFSDIQLTQFNDKMVIGDQQHRATVRSWDGDDHLVGQEVGIDMYGGNGNDLLVGSTSEDTIYGEDGNDLIIGGPSQDELWGGAGNDRFMFTQVGATDTIRDFQSGTDRIDLSDIDADLSAEGNQAFSFVGTAGFSGKAGELRVYDSGAGHVVELDVNGDSAADLMINLGSSNAVIGDFLL